MVYKEYLDSLTDEQLLGLSRSASDTYSRGGGTKARSSLLTEDYRRSNSGLPKNSILADEAYKDVEGRIDSRGLRSRLQGGRVTTMQGPGISPPINVQPSGDFVDPPQPSPVQNQYVANLKKMGLSDRRIQGSIKGTVADPRTADMASFAWETGVDKATYEHLKNGGAIKKDIAISVKPGSNGMSRGSYALTADEARAVSANRDARLRAEGYNLDAMARGAITGSPTAAYRRLGVNVSNANDVRTALGNRGTKASGDYQARLEYMAKVRMEQKKTAMAGEQGRRELMEKDALKAAEQGRDFQAKAALQQQEQRAKAQFEAENRDHAERMKKMGIGEELIKAKAAADAAMTVEDRENTKNVINAVAENFKSMGNFGAELAMRNLILVPGMNQEKITNLQNILMKDFKDADRVAFFTQFETLADGTPKKVMYEKFLKPLQNVKLPSV